MLQYLKDCASFTITSPAAVRELHCPQSHGADKHPWRPSDATGSEVARPQRKGSPGRTGTLSGNMKLPVSCMMTQNDGVLRH